MFDRMVKLAIGLSIAALAAAIAAMTYHGTVRIDGAISGWVSGIGSLAGALTALGIALWNNFKDRRDRCAISQESRERALRRAKRIQVQPLVSRERGSAKTAVTLYIRNQSGSPLYEVKWYPPVLVLPAQSGRQREVFCDTAAETTFQGNPVGNVLAASSRVVEDGQSYGVRTEFQTLPQSTLPQSVTAHLNYHVYPVVAFEDDDGYRFGWTLYGLVGSEGRDDDLSGRWDLVDDGWPENCGGRGLRELFNQAKGWAPGAPDQSTA